MRIVGAQNWSFGLSGAAAKPGWFAGAMSDRLSCNVRFIPRATVRLISICCIRLEVLRRVICWKRPVTLRLERVPF